MRPREGGFTLIELMVVIIIIGILAGVAIPQFLKTLESSKATDAAGKMALIANANRTFHLDHSGQYAGVGTQQLTSNCNNYDTTWCSSNCNGSSPPSCCLTACRYMSTNDWDTMPYKYFVLNQAGSCPAGGGFQACEGGSTPSSKLVACAARATGADGPQGTDNSPYAQWGYVMDINGVVGCMTTDTPPPPK